MSRDVSCPKEQPNRRHEMVWTMTGTYVVLACAHCQRVKTSHPIGDGDARRVAQSQNQHRTACGRPEDWTWLEAAVAA